MKIKRFLSVIMIICMVIALVPAGVSVSAAQADLQDVSANTDIAETADTGANLYGLADNVQDGQILQCWLWSYNNIRKNLQKIAEQGFSAVQVSPIQPIKESTNESWSTIMNSCWVVYQPVAFTIEDNYRNAMGTETEFRAMCKEAHKYGIKVIVDTVFNHMANDMSGNTIHPWIPSEIRTNSDCWHDISKNIYNFDDRYETTHHCLTGLPDLNTANSTVQKHCTNFLKDAIDAGADGFRFDAVKHIETPKDSSGTRSNFWPNVLNAATEYAQDTRGFTPYYYGELLGSPGSGLSVEAYTQYMSVTDTGTSDNIRNGVCNGNASAAATGSISNGAAKNKAVHWTESHDNHKDNGTNNISEHNINKTWAMVGSKDEVCALYLARPENMSTTMIGDADMTSWSYPEVKAVNRFKNAFIGQSEYLSSYNKLACVERGTSGIIIVNTGGSYYDNASVPVHKMASGTYKDVITGNTFTVSGGYIKGDIGDTGIAVVYNADSNGSFTKGSVTDFSIAGTMNDWDANSHKLVAIDANKATVTMFLTAGTYNFKLTGNGLWYGNKGTIEDTTTEVGWTVKTSVDENCTLVASGGKYTFTFNITTGKLVVMHEDTTDKSSDVYLKGTFNDWADTNVMSYVAQTNTVSTSIPLSAGTYTFKIHNTIADLWYGNAGTITDTTGENGWSMSSSESTKCTLVATGGTYIFDFNLSTNKLVVLNEKGDVVVTYIVTFKDYDGTELSKEVVERGTAATAPADPVRENTAQYTYTFKGWDTDFSNILADTEVTAVYTQTVNKYTVTFLDWDGKELYTSTVEYGSPANVPPTEPAREGYTFKGWSEDIDCVTADMTVTAVYSDNATYLKGSFNNWETKNEMVPTSNPEVLTATITLEAGTYTFKVHSRGVWYGNSGTITDTTLPSVNGWSMQTGKGNCTLVASGGTYVFNFNTTTNRVEILYTADSHTVTFKDWDGTVLDTQTVENGKSATAPVAPARDADAQYTYTFTGWDADFSDITADTVVTAVYTQSVNTYTVTFKGWDGTVLDTQTVEYAKGAVAPEAPARDGYNFTGWDTDFSSITKDTVVTAEYSKIVVPATTGKLRVDVTGGAGFRISVNGGSFRPQGTFYVNTKLPVGAEVTVVATAGTADAFLGWMNESGAVVSTTDTYTFTSTGNDYYKAMYCTAVEDVNAVIFKNSRAAGGKGQLIDMQYYSAQDEIMFPDAPSLAGYTFTGWSMTEEEIQASLAQGQDVTVTANWERAKVYIDVNVTGGTITTAAQENGKYLAYGAVTVVADTAPEGQKFAYWADTKGRIMSYNAQYKFFPSADTALVAVFVAQDVTIEKQPLVFIAGDPTTNGEKITYTISWDIDASFGTVKNYGLIVFDEADFNADTFYHGSGDSKLTDKAASVKTQTDTKSVGLGGSLYGHTYCVKSFVIYTDAVTGASVTIYSDMIEVTKLAI